MKQKKSELISGIAWYKPNQYSRILELSENRDSMHSNYLDWKKAALQHIENLKSLGLIIEKVEIDIDEVLAWCKKRNLPFNGESRSKYTAEMVRRRHRSDKK